MTNGIIEFRLTTPTETNQPMVEVWRDDIFVAGIYGHEEGLQLVSKHFDGVEHKPGYPSAVVLKLSAEVKEEEHE